VAPSFDILNGPTLSYVTLKDNRAELMMYVPHVFNCVASISRVRCCLPKVVTFVDLVVSADVDWTWRAVNARSTGAPVNDWADRVGQLISHSEGNTRLHVHNFMIARSSRRSRSLPNDNCGTRAMVTCTSCNCAGRAFEAGGGGGGGGGAGGGGA
jgi:hypothetical protein